MALINDRPFLEYQLDFLDKWGINKVILSVGYMREIIMDHFGGKYKSIDILYAEEETSLGTGGGIRNAFRFIEGYAAYVLNGDTYFDVNLQKMNNFRRMKNADITIILREVFNVNRFGKVEIDKENRIIAFNEKSEDDTEGFVNGGVYLINKEYFMNFDFPKCFSIERDFFQKNVNSEMFYGLLCYSYFRDIGVPEDYQKAQDEFKRIMY